MKLLAGYLSLFAIGILLLAQPARAQDNGSGGEPIVPSIDPSTLTYDYLVDGNLSADDPVNKKFTTLQAAYAAAPAGTATKQTVIGIMPNVYQITGGVSTPGMTISKNFITLLGLTNNRRSVVLADNRGNKQGAGTDTTSYNGFVIIVSATGFRAENLTFLNYCNVDYEYPGDSSKNLAKRSGVITQAVALQASGDKHVYVNVAILSRLDTMFLSTTRSYFKNVFIEGTDDFVGGGTISVWQDCEILFPTGNGVPSFSGITFINTKFTSAGGMQFYKGAGSPVTLINCTLPVYTPQAPVAWIRGNAASRPNLYSMTYHVKDANGNPAVVIDSDRATASPTFTYSREISDQEALAFNPWNLLRATPTGTADDWDPAGVRTLYEGLGQGSLIYRMAMTGANPSIRTGAPGATIGATVSPARAPDKTITWSTDSNLINLSATTGPSVTVTGNNGTDFAQYVKVNATAVNGFYVSAWVFVEPTYINPPAVLSGPTLNSPANGLVHVDYTLDLGDHPDQSLVSWYICDDANGTNARNVAVSRGNVPLRDLPLTPGYIGKFIEVRLQPKHNISDPGPTVVARTTSPIVPSDIRSIVVSPDFQNFVTTANSAYVSGLWTVLGTWTSSANSNFLPDGYGVRVGSQGASLNYQQDTPFGDMQIRLIMAPEKTAGQGFGSPGSGTDGDTIQKSDIFIKYDPRTRTGYSLRYWRTTLSAEKCMFQLYRIVNGVGSPLNSQQVLTGVFKPNTYMTLKIIGTAFTVDAYNDVDSEVLSLQGTITPNQFGGTGVYWSGTVPTGNSNVYTMFEISYPNTPANISVSGYSGVYDGLPHGAHGSATGVFGEDLSGLLNLGASFTNVPGGTVNWTFAGNGYADASGTAAIVITQAAGTVAVGTPTDHIIRLAYDGTPKSGNISTIPAGLNATFTYNGSSTPPTLPGTYAVVATIDDRNYMGSAEGTLVVTITALVRHAPTLSGDIDGSAQVLLPEDVALSGAMISGDLLVPGTPSVVINGHPTYGSTIDASGDASPADRTVTLGGNSILRHVVRRVDPIPLPTVGPPPAPAGARDVTLNKAGQNVGDFASLRNFTLTGNAGVVAVPPGTYGAFAANASTGYIFGVAGATAPAVYNLQSLTLGGNAGVQIVGPVILTLGKGIVLSGTMGAAEHPDWLQLKVYSDGLTLNGNATLHGYVLAPRGPVVINGNGTLNGEVAADQLTINGNGLLNEPQSQ